MLLTSDLHVVEAVPRRRRISQDECFESAQHFRHDELVRFKIAIVENRLPNPDPLSIEPYRIAVGVPQGRIRCPKERALREMVHQTLVSTLNGAAQHSDASKA